MNDVEVILNENVRGVGRVGDIVRVRPGYARNFLFPQKLALFADENAKKKFKELRAALLEKDKIDLSEAAVTAEKLSDVSCRLYRQAGDRGRLFGSVSAKDVANSLKEHVPSIKRDDVLIHSPIKFVGVYEVDVVLHVDVVVAIHVVVGRDADDCESVYQHYLKNKRDEHIAKFSIEDKGSEVGGVVIVDQENPASDASDNVGGSDNADLSGLSDDNAQDNISQSDKAVGGEEESDS